MENKRNVRSKCSITFDPFCLDRSNECLWRGSQLIRLRPKAYAVLNQLVVRPGELVTKQQLLAAVWPDTFVGEAVLKVTIRQLRDALEDDSKSPRFIETAHRRGYRFIGQIAEEPMAPETDQLMVHDTAALASQPREHDLPIGLVGRDEALAQMRGWLQKTLRGERQIVFVTGEAGIGKTALVDTFARYVAFDRNIRIGTGQCLEQYGTGEAYLPILEAIGRLCRADQTVVDILRTHAPLWLLQMPSLLSASEREALAREVLGATRERMLREMGAALEVLASDRPLVLILEDLHWSDRATLDLISYMATQRQPAHLMMIGTYRSEELIVSGHPLRAVKQELVAKQQCEELRLTYLTEGAIAKYLSVRFADNRFPGGLAQSIYERTEGNSLFMVNVVDYLVTQGSIVKNAGCWELIGGMEKVEVGVPDSIKQMIEKHIEHLDAAVQRILEAASLAGTEFSTLAVTAALGEDHAMVEARCHELARQRLFIQDCGVQVLPNGQAAGRYGFIHALYQNVLSDRVSSSRRVQFHLRIGDRGEEIYGERAQEIAAELAMHFERGGDYKRAAKYLQRAADNAIRRFAYREAVALAQHGLKVTEHLPDSTERAEQELCLQLTLGVPLMATNGYAATEVGNTYRRARELCQQLGETPDVSEVLWGLWAFHIVRAELVTAREIADEFLRLAEQFPYPGLALRGHLAMEVTLVHIGDFAPAMEHFEKALSLYDPEQHRDDVVLYSQDSGVTMLSHGAWALWFLGQPDRSVKRMQEALSLAHELAEPHGLAHAFYFASILHHLRREEQLAQEYAEAAIKISSEHGLTLYQAMSTITRGWASFDQGSAEEGIQLICHGLAAHVRSGTQVARPHFLALLGEAQGRSGLAEDGVRLLNEALASAERINEGCYLAELYRVKGELELAHAGEGSEACFRKSIEIAQRQQARSLELRATMSLARLYRENGRAKEARSLLAPIYESFTEGFDTLDLLEAKALLHELS
jgi:DNA-binding winged helix-turn-helix (wHTH) protein/predicted ATPase